MRFIKDSFRGAFGPVAIATAGTLAVLVVGGVWLTRSRIDAAPLKESHVSEERPSVRDLPIACRIIPVAEDERRAAMAKWDLFKSRPERLTAKMCRNPLVAGPVFARVEFKNTSSGPFAVIPSDGRLFRVAARIEDADGHAVSFDRPTLRSLKHIALSGAGQEPVELKPGHNETQWFEFLGVGTFNLDVKPGRYQVRAVGTCSRPVGQADWQVVSAPFWITITDDDIREWRALHDNPPAGVEEPN
jgi:hypothetical protein